MGGRKQRSDARTSGGFTLIECVTALTIIMVLALGGATLVERAVYAGTQAHARTVATMLAAAKTEELRALPWAAPGLRPSAMDAATRSTPGYVDYVDAQGRTIGTSVSPPAAARYVRRWAVVPLASDPDDALIFIVMVSSIVDDARGSETSWRAARLVSLRSRSQP